MDMTNENLNIRPGRPRLHLTEDEKKQRVEKQKLAMQKWVAKNKELIKQRTRERRAKEKAENKHHCDACDRSYPSVSALRIHNTTAKHRRAVAAIAPQPAPAPVPAPAP
jgi:hypothetical protein